MATQILNAPTGVALSSSLTDLAILTDEQSVTVRLCEAATGRELFKERLYAYGGEIRLLDLASLVEDSMRPRNLSFARFSLKVFSVSDGDELAAASLPIIYCDRHALSGEFSASAHFLTLMPVRRLASADLLSVSYYADDSDQVDESVSADLRRVSDGTVVRVSHVIRSGWWPPDADVYAISIGEAELQELAATEHGGSAADYVPLMAVVRCDRRTMTAYFDPELREQPVLMYRNCFNVLEAVSLPSVTTAKTAVERSTAVRDGRLRLYDQTVTKEFEVEAGPLLKFEADAIDELLSSLDVYKVDTVGGDSVATPIVITESTCEIKESDGELPSVKFTWRYAPERPILRMPHSPGIFTNRFTPQFT